MKENLSVEEIDFAKIEEWQREIVKRVNYSRLYSGSCELHTNTTLTSIVSNKMYIDSLYQLIGYLYNYYEVSPKHFELLNYALENLERLYKEQIKSLPSCEYDELAKLSAYLNKGALIFEIATDRMEVSEIKDEYRRKTYIEMALTYSKKADELLGISWDKKKHTAKMLSICDESTAVINHRRDFFREPFRVMAIKYREKCAKEAETQDARKTSDQYASATVAETEIEPLLEAISSIPRSRSDGLLTRAKGAVMFLTSFFQKAPKKDEPAHRAARAASAPAIEIDSEKNISELHRRKNS